MNRQSNIEYLKKFYEGNIEEAIKRLKGIPCGFRPTSCPDQLARALEEVKEQIK